MTNDDYQLTPLPLKEHVVMESETSARDQPYWVRGRDHEIAHIVRNLANLPKPISLIVGMPGIGKSTLLKHLREHAKRMGCKVIRLRPADFASHVTLADAIREVRTTHQETPDATARTAGGMAEAGISKLARASVDAHATASRTSSRPGDWLQAMDTVVRAAPNGVMFTLDEVQLMDVNLKDAERVERVKNFMNEIHSESAMEADRKVTLICAGLSDAPKVLNAFDMTRIENNHTLRLGPLTERASRQILHDHITAQTATGGTLPSPPAALVDAMVRDCGGCAHHLAWAGWRIQEQAKRVQRAGRTEWLEAEASKVMDRLTVDRNGLYTGRLPLDAPRAMLETAYVLAAATARWGDQLPQNVVEDVAEAIAVRHPAETKDTVLGWLIHKGVVELRDGDHLFLTRSQESSRSPHYVFPVHNMATWARDERQTKAEAPWQLHDSEAVLLELFGSSGPETRVPAWIWDDTAPIDPLPAAADLAQLPEQPAALEPPSATTPVALPEPSGLLPEVNESEILHPKFKASVKRLTQDMLGRVRRAGSALVEPAPTDSESPPTPVKLPPSQKKADDDQP